MKPLQQRSSLPPAENQPEWIRTIKWVRPTLATCQYTVNSVTFGVKFTSCTVACSHLPSVPWGSCSKGPEAHWPQSTPELSYPSHQNNEPRRWPLPLPRPVYVRTWNQYQSDRAWAKELSKRSFTLDMKSPASMIDLMCLNQSEFSSPVRNSPMEGERSAETKKNNNRHFEKIQINSLLK